MRRAAGARALAALAARAAGTTTGATATTTTSGPLGFSPRGPPPSSFSDSAIACAPPGRPAQSLLPVLAAWQRALHVPTEGRRMAAAAAAAAHPMPAAVEEGEEGAAAAAAEARARRLHELQQHTEQQQPQPRRRQLDLSRVPMLDVKGAGGCSSSSSSAAKPVRAAPPPVDWREVVRRARASAAVAAAAQGRETDVTSPLLLDADPLTDLHGRTHDYLRISLTERCNLRCSYCMPEEGVELTPSPELLTPSEVQRLARLFVRAGVTKIRLTGGEPTVRRDLADVVAALAELQGEGLRSIALTSNGVTLERQLPKLRAAGLTHLNVSLDTLSPGRFERLTRRPAEAHARVIGALDAALELGFGGALGGGSEAAGLGAGGARAAGGTAGGALGGGGEAAAPAGVKLNVVVVRGVNDDEVESFSALTRSAALNVRFIEYMPFDGNAWGKGKGMVPYAELRARADLYAARAAAEAQAQAAAAAAAVTPAQAWQQQLASVGAWGGFVPPPPPQRAMGGFAATAAAYHRLAGAGGGADVWEQQQQQQQGRRRPPAGPVTSFAAEAAAALPLTPPPLPPASAPFSATSPLLALRRLDDHPSEVAKNFRAPGHAGTLSFVTSMTSHFCGGCSRLRLLADGALKVCLFGASEVSLRDACRGGATDGELMAVVGAAVRRKKASHAGMHEIARTSNRPMITIGG